MTLIALDPETKALWQDVTLVLDGKEVGSEMGLDSGDVDNVDSRAFEYQGKLYPIEDCTGDILSLMYEMVDPT